ncbi:FHA domain-containing protein [Anaerovoracaceae bacterium 42-11]
MEKKNKSQEFAMAMKTAESPLICPLCGKELKKKTLAGEGTFFIHEGRSRCKAKYKTKKEILDALNKELAEAERKEDKKAEVKRNDDEPAIINTITMDEYKKIADNSFFEELEKNLLGENGEKENNKILEVEKTTAFDIPAQKETDERKKFEEAAVEEKKKPAKRIKSLDGKRFIMHEVDEKEAENLRAYIVKAVENPPEKKKEDVLPIEKKPEIENDEKVEEENYGETQLLTPVAEENEIQALKYPSLTRIETGEVYDIDKPVYRIGKNTQCSIRLTENVAVSRLHAELLVKNGTCYIRDLGSKNGTFVEDFKIPPETEMEIKDGQTLKFANEEFLFNMNE